MANGELEIIRKFLAKAPRTRESTYLPAGDDASLHRLPDQRLLALSVDVALMGVHWPMDFPLHMAGRRSVNAALSDLAAMGAEAHWAWLGVMVDSRKSGEELADGCALALSEFGVELAGGDTVRSPVNAVSVTVGGTVDERKVMKRNLAKPGDDVWLCGTLGASAYGLRLWKRGVRSGPWIEAFAVPRPRLEEGRRLASQGVRCCIDVSDGLLLDAKRISEASQVGMTLYWSNLPGVEALAREGLSQEEIASFVLAGGEDYALLFTADPSRRSEFERHAVRIGTCCQRKGIWVLDDGGKAMRVDFPGYDHFR